jgi:hypothetical protein
MPRLQGIQVAAFARNGGFNGNDLITAVAVAKGESGWNTDSRLWTSAEDSRGLWQINCYAHPWGYNINLYDGAVNGQAAFRVFREAGYRWTPWTVYTRGIYRQFWNEAVDAVNSLSGGAIQSFGPASGQGPIQSFGPADPVGAFVGGWDHAPDVHVAADLMARSAGDHGRLEGLMRSLII